MPRTMAADSDFCCKKGGQCLHATATAAGMKRVSGNEYEKSSSRVRNGESGPSAARV
jgi:hypothetical protein